MTGCQLFAQWRVGEAAELWRPPDPEPRDTFAAADDSGGRPDVLPAIPEWTDDTTEAALAAWRKEGIPLWVDAAGVYFSDRLPLLIRHVVREPLAELRVDRVGSQFTAIGEVAPSAAQALSGMTAVSDKFHFRRAHVVELAPGIRIVRVTSAELVELSATDAPALADTVLFVGQAGVSWLPGSVVERFAHYDLPDQQRFARSAAA